MAEQRQDYEVESDVDFAAVHADDAFLDALSAGHPIPAPGDELAGLLAAWRSDVDAVPIAVPDLGGAR